MNFTSEIMNITSVNQNFTGVNKNFRSVNKNFTGVNKNFKSVNKNLKAQIRILRIFNFSSVSVNVMYITSILRVWPLIIQVLKPILIV